MPASAAGEPAILMRPDTSTEDVAGFAAAAGIVTAVGARTALQEIQSALGRIDDGRFGHCVSCGDDLDLPGFLR